jgi:hypothetical protein
MACPKPALAEPRPVPPKASQPHTQSRATLNGVQSRSAQGSERGERDEKGCELCARLLVRTYRLLHEAHPPRRIASIGSQVAERLRRPTRVAKRHLQILLVREGFEIFQRAVLLRWRTPLSPLAHKPPRMGVRDRQPRPLRAPPLASRSDLLKRPRERPPTRNPYRYDSRSFHRCTARTDRACSSCSGICCAEMPDTPTTIWFTCSGPSATGAFRVQG